MDQESTKNKTRNDLDALKREVDKLSSELSSTRDELARTNDLLYRVFLIDRYSFEKNVEILQSLAMDKGSTVGFFGVTPTTQQTAITTPSGGGGSTSDAVDITGRTAIGQIKTALANVGITA